LQGELLVLADLAVKAGRWWAFANGCNRRSPDSFNLLDCCSEGAA